MQLERYTQILEGIELERKHEEKYFFSLSKQKSVEEKIDSGILWYPCDVLKSYFTIGERVEVQFQRRYRKEVPHKLKTGAACIAYVKNQLDVNYKGVISFLRKDKIGIIFTDEKILSDNDFLKGQVSIELIYDERPYRIMKAAIETVCSSQVPFISQLRNGIVEKDSFDSKLQGRDSKDVQYLHLNESQKLAVYNGLEAETISIIHGPPGTGKTTTLVHLIRLLSKYEKKILVCAPSNNATDLLARQLDEMQLKVVRVGNVSRISDDIAHLSIASLAANSNDWQHIKKVKIAADEALKKANKFKRFFGEQEKKERRLLRKESKDLRKWARELEEKLVHGIMSDAQVICSTLIGASSKEIEGMQFDTLVIDEASQALEAECWNAILKSNRVILAGDHLQLPPTVMSEDAKDKRFDITLLDLLTDQIAFKQMLNVQYRMNDKILAFPNHTFYKGALGSDNSVANRYLVGQDQGVVFIDTAGAGFDESLNNETRSRRNEGEYFILREHFLQSKHNYIDQSIGIISPYSEQVKYIRGQIELDDTFTHLDTEVNSIDGFQGQEKDIIYISLVRSNDHNEIGFLKDPRRFNVAITRARKLLVVIGDSATIGQNKMFANWIDQFDKSGLYESAWQYMNLE